VRPSTLKRRREALRALVALEEAHSDPFGLAAMRLDRIPTAAMEDAISVIGERAPASELELVLGGPCGDWRLLW
jgi:hypothetical protein